MFEDFRGMGRNFWLYTVGRPMATTPLGMAVAGPLLDRVGGIAVTLYYLRFRETVINIGSENAEVVP